MLSKTIMRDFLGALSDASVFSNRGALSKIKGVGEFSKSLKVEIKPYSFNSSLIFNKGFSLGKAQLEKSNSLIHPLSKVANSLLKNSSLCLV